eukprot:35139-Chlamydomonas_euryale.AAC.1
MDGWDGWMCVVGAEKARLANNSLPKMGVGEGVLIEGGGAPQGLHNRLCKALHAPLPNNESYPHPRLGAQARRSETCTAKETMPWRPWIHRQP